MIDYIDPADLPGARASGPQSWGEAWRNAAAATDDTMRLVENITAGPDTRKAAYQSYIDEVQQATGVKLRNPMDVDLSTGTFDARPNPTYSLDTGNEWRQARIDDAMKSFDAERNSLAEKFPAQARLIQLDIEGRTTRLMKDAEKRQAEAMAAPELGMFGRFTAGLAGGLKGSARDPYQVGMSFIGAGAGTGATVAARLGRIMLTEAIINGGQEAVLQAASQERKKQAGLEYGLEDALKNVGVAAVFGALFGGTLQGGAELARIYRLGEGGAERAARVMDGRPEPGDVETLAKEMGVELGPEKLDLINRSFEERTLDEATLRPDATPNEVRVHEAAMRYAEDPDNNPPPEVIERMLAEEEAGRLFDDVRPDQVELARRGEPNAVDDIAETFFARDLDEAKKKIDAISAKVDDLTAKAERQSANERSYSLQNDQVAEAAYADGTEHVRLMRGSEHLATAVISRDGDRVIVDRMFSAGVNAEGFNTVGPSAMREFARLVADRYPDARVLEGVRVGGARHQGRYVGDHSQGVDAGIPLSRIRREPADPIADQRIRPARPAEPLDDAAMRAAEEQAGEIREPSVDANGNAANLFEFLPVEDGNGNVVLMRPADALALADEGRLLAEVMEACKL